MKAFGETELETGEGLDDTKHLFFVGPAKKRKTFCARNPKEFVLKIWNSKIQKIFNIVLGNDLSENIVSGHHFLKFRNVETSSNLKHRRQIRICHVSFGKETFCLSALFFIQIDFFHQEGT